MTNKQRKIGRKSEWKSMWLWIVFILFFFGLQALLWTTAVRLARRHPVRPVPLTYVSPVESNTEPSQPTTEEN